MVSLQVIQSATARRTRVHVDIERLMVETALINRLIIIHRYFEIGVHPFVQNVTMHIMLQSI